MYLKLYVLSIYVQTYFKTNICQVVFEYYSVVLYAAVGRYNHAHYLINVLNTVLWPSSGVGSSND